MQSTQHLNIHFTWYYQPLRELEFWNINEDEEKIYLEHDYLNGPTFISKSLFF